MKEKIENIVKFGVPILVFLILLFIQFFDNNGGAEFKGLGTAIILASFIILYLIAGIIVRSVSKNNFIILSAVFSLAVIFVYFFIFISTSQLRIEQAEKNRQEERKQQAEYDKLRLLKYQQEYDSLTIIIKNSDNNLKEVEKRALLYLDVIYKYDSSKDLDEKRKKHIEELEFAVKNKTQNTDVYYVLYNCYYTDLERIEVLEAALKTDSLSEYYKSFFNKKLSTARFMQKEEIRRIKLHHEWSKDKLEADKLLIKNINTKFKNEGYNDVDLVKRGVAYCELNKDKEALADYNKALELNPENTTAFIQKACVLSYLEQYSEALVLFEKCKKIYPYNNLFFQICIDEIKEKQEKMNIANND